MEKISSNFNDFVNANFKFENKYIIAVISLCLAIYAGLYAPKLPEFMIKLLDNILIKILLMFMILYVNFNAEPAVSLLVAICVAVLLLAVNNLRKNKEQMALLTGVTTDGVPPFVYSMCGHPRHPCDPEHIVKGACANGECEKKDETQNVFVDGPVSGVTDAEMESLCMHLKKDKNATDEILGEASFSELVNAKEACDFASHQYKVDFPDVKCAEQAVGNSHLFSNLAPAQ